MDTGTPSDEPPLYCYGFGNAQFDEARAELRVGGLAVDLEQRPLQVLALLLRHADEVVTREELFDTVWAGRPTVDNVLANAVAKLRKALGPGEAGRVVNVPRVGYRLVGPIQRTVAGRRLRSQLALRAGEPVPGRSHFRLREQLAPAHGSEVWLARHDKTGEARVYKFATAGDRLAALKREATLYRVLHEGLGDRDDFVRVIDWNFEDAPFFLECAWAGVSLAHWAEDPAGLPALEGAARLATFLQIADAVAAAHRVGVLHKDLKPSNVLVMPEGAGWRLRVGDFGSGRLMEPERLDQLGITALGLTVTQVLADDASGTPLYLAPELLGGQAPTVQSDVYALGLILYQIWVGDLRRPLAPGWESAVDDELLREDIAAATAGDPAQRLASVAELADRLRRRDMRRLERARLRETEARAMRAERRLERSRARRPWIVAAVLLLMLGLGVSLWQYRRAGLARDEAQRQAAIANATNRFLNEDLLGAGIGGDSPAWYEKNPSLREILDAAAQRLDARYRKAPLLAASLHQTLGRAYRATGDFASASTQLGKAAELMQGALGAGDDRVLLARYELAVMQAHLSHFDQATSELDRADRDAGVRRQSVSEIGLRSHLARGDVEYQRMQVKAAYDNYLAAQTIQRILHPDDVPMAAHILLSLAGCDLRLGRAADAERIARQVLGGAPFTRERIGRAVLGMARSRLGDALRAQGRYAEALPVVSAALADFAAVQGPDGQGTISTLSTLGYLYSLSGDDRRALSIERDVYQRTLHRWGPDSQYTLVERLNLGTQEQDAGDLTAALADIRAAGRGLARTSGEHSPVLQAARVAEAGVLSALGQQAQALALIDQVDPAAYQSTTSDPGRAAVLSALRAQILWRMGRIGEARPRLRQALADMQRDGVAEAEQAPFRALLAKGPGTAP